MFDQIPVWTLAGPFQNLHFLLVKPYFCWFGCMLWVIVMLKDEVPLHLKFSYRSLKVLCSHWIVFTIISSSATKAPVPDEEKQPQSIIVPPPCFTAGTVDINSLLCCSSCKVFVIWKKKNRPIQYKSIQVFPPLMKWLLISACTTHLRCNFNK